MPVIKKTKKLKKSAVVKKSVKSLTKKKNAHQYYVCMAQCCQGKISPKRISEVAHECKTNALAVSKKMSVEKVKDIKKLALSLNKFQQDLGEYIKKH